MHARIARRIKPNYPEKNNPRYSRKENPDYDFMEDFRRYLKEENGGSGSATEHSLLLDNPKAVEKAKRIMLAATPGSVFEYQSVGDISRISDQIDEIDKANKIITRQAQEYVDQRYDELTGPDKPKT